MAPKAQGAAPSATEAGDGESRIAKGAHTSQQSSALAGSQIHPINDPEWLTAYSAQNTPALRRRAMRQIAAKAWMLEQHGVRADSYFAEDLIEDILVDTCLGRLTWDPAKGSLARHVRLTVSARISHLSARAERFSLASLDDDEATQVEVEQLLRETTPVSTAEGALSALQAVSRLRELARMDDDVLAIINANCAGHLERSAVMRAAGLDARRYAAARARLDRLLEDLPLAMMPRGRAAATAPQPELLAS